MLALFSHLNLQEPVVLLGNSLGGVIGVEIFGDMNFALAWDGTLETREELEQRIGSRFLPYFQDSFRKTKNGWRLAFNPHDMVASNNCTVGDHWKEWLSTNCPALLLRGKESRVTTQTHLEQMASQRSNTLFYTLEGGHIIHFDNPASFNEVARKFLKELKA